MGGGGKEGRKKERKEETKEGSGEMGAVRSQTECGGMITSGSPHHEKWTEQS